jgi:integrase
MKSNGNIKAVKRAGGVVYQAYGRRDGAKAYIGSFATEQEAKEKLEDHRVTQRQIQRGELPPELDRRRTLNDALDAWMRQCRLRSKDAYRSRLDLYIRPRLGKVALVQVTAGMILDLQSALCDRGLDATTVNSGTRTLSSAYAYFIKSKWVAANPVRDVPEIEGRARAHNWIKSRDEQERLLAACDEPLRTFVAVLLMTGMRLGEVIHLEWSDVDLDLRQITVQRGAHGTTKSGKVRMIPINNSLLLILKSWRLRSGGSGLVFPSSKAQVRSASGIYMPFKKALVRAGLDPSLRVHDCRHTYASHYLREGGSIFRLSRYLGHSSVQVTERFYAHMIPADFEQDWGRNCLHLRDADAAVIKLVPGDKRETAPVDIDLKLGETQIAQ